MDKDGRLFPNPIRPWNDRNGAKGSPYGGAAAAAAGGGSLWITTKVSHSRTKKSGTLVECAVLGNVSL